MGNSKIEWTEKTWNPVVGCSKISPGCAHCYAETMANRLKGMALKDIADGKDPGRKRHYIDAIDDKGRWSGKMIPVPESLDAPLTWKKPQMCFVNSMSDLFHEALSFDFIDQIFAAMYSANWHTYQILTKRPDRMREYFRSQPIPRIGTQALMQFTRQEPIKAADNLLRNTDLVDDIASMWPLPNVWLGTSCESQNQADLRIPFLFRCPAVVRFLSCEPLLGPIDLNRIYVGDPQLNVDALGGLDWVICGGESGPNARPMHPEWVRSLRDQCVTAEVPFFFKQWGNWLPFYDRDIDDPDWQRIPETTPTVKRMNAAGGQGFHGDRVVYFSNVGKKSDGRMLDGREWNEFPEVGEVV